MFKRNRIVIIISSIVVVLFLIVGIPIIINECYKANCGYSTAWDASAMLGYYGTILGAVITMVTLIATISFTKKQIQRDSYLKTESEKWSTLKLHFLKILETINPMITLKDVMDNGFIDPSKAINILQRYQFDCCTATDLLNAYLNMNDYPKVKHIIDEISAMSEEFISLCAKEVDQYTDYNDLKNRDTFIKIVDTEIKYPGSFSEEDLASSQEKIEKLKTINIETISLQIRKLNGEIINVYKTKYRNLLKEIGATFDVLESEAAQTADRMLDFRIMCSHRSKTSKRKGKGKRNGSN